MHFLEKALFLTSTLCCLFSGQLVSAQLKKIPVSTHEQEDIQMLLSGGYFPLKGFINSQNYHLVLEEMHLVDGSFWPIPITLPIQKAVAKDLSIGDEIYLTDDTNHPIAKLKIEEIYAPDPIKECQSVFGSTDTNHYFIKKLLQDDFLYVAGEVKNIHSPSKAELYQAISTPEEIKNWKKANHIDTLIGFQTRNPLHRAHVEAIKESWNQVEGKNKALLLHPTCGSTQKGDIPAAVRLECYKAILPELGNRQVKLSMLPLPMRMAGPKEALLHALVRKNYGCTHFIVGRDHAGPSVRKKDGSTFFHSDASYKLAKQHESDLKINIIPCEELSYVMETDSFMKKDEIPQNATIGQVSGTKLRNLLSSNQEIPNWISYPKVLKILRNYYQSTQGICFYIFGLPASGKSTISKILKEKLEKHFSFQKNIVILDADSIRKNIGQELGFSKEHRSINVRRIGYLASKIVESGGICIVANIAPFQEDRDYNHALIESKGSYFEIYVSTPVEVCAERDPKDLYKDAKTGLVKNLTGFSQGFDIPKSIQFSISNVGTIQDLENQIEEIILQVF